MAALRCYRTGPILTLRTARSSGKRNPAMEESERSCGRSWHARNVLRASPHGVARDRAYDRASEGPLIAVSRTIQLRAAASESAPVRWPNAAMSGARTNVRVATMETCRRQRGSLGPIADRLVRTRSATDGSFGAKGAAWATAVPPKSCTDNGNSVQATNNCN